jgi:putative PIN family toxin of toxin-antitoxin system
MRILLDTNVLVAAFIAHGTCNEVLEHAALHHEIVLSKFILDELRRVLREKFKFSEKETRGTLRLLRGRCLLVKPDPLEDPVCRDADDDFVLATAVAGKCVCIVTGDKDLLDIGEFRGIRIITPDSYWAFEDEENRIR